MGGTREAGGQPFIARNGLDKTGTAYATGLVPGDVGEAVKHPPGHAQRRASLSFSSGALRRFFLL